MNRALFAGLCLTFLYSLSLFGGEGAATAAPTREATALLQARHIDDPAQDGTDGDLPTVSKFQTPGAVPRIGCGDPSSGQPCVDDGGGGGAVGSCSCSRICWDNNVICHLATSTPNIGCAAGIAGSFCKPCWDHCRF